MRIPGSLRVKLLAWFFINVVGLVIGGILFVRVQSGAGVDSIPDAVTNARLQTFASEVVAALSASEESEWDRLLEELEASYEVELALLTPDGFSIAGRPRLVEEARERRGMRPPPPPPPGALPAPTGSLPAGPYRIDSSEDGSTRYVTIRIPLPDRVPANLVLRSSSGVGPLFFRSRPWIAAAAIAVVGSMLFWLPLISDITGRVGRVTAATKAIAGGGFHTRLRDDGASDELTALVRAVNAMAERLESYASGQKRFLGDIAHELSAPISRMQAAIALLETKVDARDSLYLAKLDTQLQEMSTLVNELLFFSRTSVQASPQLQPTELLPLIKRVVALELDDESRLQSRVEPELKVMAVPRLLERAISNLFRNALRYAGADANVWVSATRETNGDVYVTIGDDGPGVPSEALPYLFDAFYRPAAARDRESGGSGLGLAIVKACVAACGGSVTAENRRGGGFEVRMTLKAVP